MECVQCSAKFKKKNKGFRRNSLDRNLKGFLTVSVRDTLTDQHSIELTPRAGKSIGLQERSVCDSCFNLLTRIHKLTLELEDAKKDLDLRVKPDTYIGQKRKSCDAVFNTQKTPVKKVKTTPKLEKIKSPRAFIESLITSIRTYHYDAALKMLYRKSKRGKRAIVKVTQNIIREEMKALFSQKSLLEQELTLQSLSEFRWMPILKELTSVLPLLTSALTAGLTSARKEDSVAATSTSVGPLTPVLGLSLANIIHMRKPHRYNLLQKMNSVQMYRSGCGQKLFKWFQKVGICHGLKGTMGTIDRLTKEFDVNIKTWKHTIQHELGNTNAEPKGTVAHMADIGGASTDQPTESSDATTDVPTDEPHEHGVATDDDGSDGLLPFLSDDSDAHDVKEAVVESREPGYALCWDNVQKMSITRHQMRSSKNKMMMWALSFGVRNRINFRHLLNNGPIKRASDIPIHKFLPSPTDFVDFRSRLQLTVQGILTEQFPWLKEVAVEAPPQHMYSAESAIRSEIVHLGVIAENPASAKGTTEIMKHLLRYVPADADGNPYHIVCHGDQLSVERMIDARNAMALSQERMHRLEGLEPRPQGFHKRCILMV